MQKPLKAAPKRINVALQGGGSHGAFTWGVLDRLLEDERIEIEAISGSSAGAMNAVVVAEGLVEGGRAKAREQLADFWRRVSASAMGSPFHNSYWQSLLTGWTPDYNPALAMVDMWTHVLSPYVLNPMNINPLRDLVLDEVDFDRVRSCHSLRLFVSATNVHTGRVKVFTGNEVSIDAVMASACLPHLFQAVVIDDVPYWDGGFVGNPVLFPFLDHCNTQDMLLVQINPIERRHTPTTSREILDRMNEISFNDSLIKELQHVDFVNEALRAGALTDRGYREIFLHLISGGEEFGRLTASTKLNVDWDFLTQLRDFGRAAAAQWLDAHFAKLGIESSMDLSGIRREPGRPPRHDRIPALATKP